MIRPFAFRTGAEQATHLIEKGIISALAYFDVFRYPLTIGEIEQFRAPGEEEIDIHACLNSLLKKQVVFRLGDFYSLQSNILLGHRRREGNKKAQVMIDKAVRVGRFLHRFPFVKAVGISGSLSKNYAVDDSDFDFFIITSANRLWVARTIMHAYKKLAILFGKQRYFCMNYYIDEMAMELTDRNIYTAIELKTLLPVTGTTQFEKLFSSNSWADELLPYCNYRKQSTPDPRKGSIKKAFEAILNSNVGEALDEWFFTISSKRWKKKELEGKTNNRGDVMCLLSSKHIAKSNPGDFQETILKLYNQRFKEILEKLKD